MIEDSCDTLGATLAGHARPARARRISVTSFANSHIITCAGNGGMVMIDDDALRDRAVMLRRWGRRSELHFFGSKRRDRDFWEDLDGIHYDNQFIFDELAWNFEPSEMGAAFGLEQLKKLPTTSPGGAGTSTRYTEFFGAHGDRFALPRQLPDLETAWLGYPLMHRARRRVRAGRPAGVPRRARHRHPHHLDRQRHPPADARRRRGAASRRRPPQRRRGHGARRAAAAEPRHRRRHARLRDRAGGGVPPAGRDWGAA